MNKAFFIAAGMEYTRKKINTYSHKNLYLNYGLLSIATQVKRGGIESIQIQGDFNPPEDTIKTCIELGITNQIVLNCGDI